MEHAVGAPGEPGDDGPPGPPGIKGVDGSLGTCVSAVDSKLAQNTLGEGLQSFNYQVVVRILASRPLGQSAFRCPAYL